jgi:hypothetical protein
MSSTSYGRGRHLRDDAHPIGQRTPGTPMGGGSVGFVCHEVSPVTGLSGG